MQLTQSNSKKDLFFNTAFFVYYLSYSLIAKTFYKLLVDGAQADSMTS